MTTTAPEIVELPLDVIEPNPHNARVNLRGILALAESITENGLLQSLVVAPAGGGRYVLIAGHRRYAAATTAKLATVRCEIRRDLNTEILQRRAMLAENLQRDDFNDVEEGDAYQGLFELGIGPAALAKDTGRSQKQIRDRAKLATAPERIRTGVADREITLEQAVILQRYEKSPHIYADLEKALGTVNWDFAVERAKETAALNKTIAKIRKELVADGVRVFDNQAASHNWVVAQQKARDTVLGSQVLDERPDDAATNQDVFVHFGHNSSKLCWRRIYTVEAADPVTSPTPTGTTKPTTPTTDLAADRARAQAEIEAANRLAADLKTATPVRRAHLKAVLAKADTDLAAECLRLQLSEQLGELDIEQVHIFSRIAGFDEQVTANGLELWAYSLRVNQLAVALRIAANIPNDEWLEQLTGWQHRNYLGREGAQWRNEIGTVFGYEWSDPETELLTQFDADAAAADN